MTHGPEINQKDAETQKAREKDGRDSGGKKNKKYRIDKKGLKIKSGRLRMLKINSKDYREMKNKVEERQIF